MRVLLLLILHSFHYVYTLILTLRSFWQQFNSNTPQPLQAPRRRVPNHLAILFVTDSTIHSDTCRNLLSESIINAVEWCRLIGISKLTVYEENDTLSECIPNIRESLAPNTCDTDSSSESDTEYPLTPPPSDYSESRPLSPSHLSAPYIPHATIVITGKETTKKSSPALRQRLQSQQQTHCKPITLCIISRKSAKSAIANVATGIAQSQRPKRTQKVVRNGQQPVQVTVKHLDHFLEDDEGLSSPDFMIVHPITSSKFSSIPELHAFPPWQIRLTEICQNSIPLSNSFSLPWSVSNIPAALKEIEFRAALDEFASAEMRFGK